VKCCFDPDKLVKSGFKKYVKILGAAQYGGQTHAPSQRQYASCGILEKDMQATTVYNLIYRLKAEGVDFDLAILISRVKDQRGELSIVTCQISVKLSGLSKVIASLQTANS
jgi:hypothetical protein